MGKNSFKLIFPICLFFIIHFSFVSFSFAAVLHWSPVPSTQECLIAGYNVHYGTISGQYTQFVDVGDQTFYDLDLLDLVPGQTYYFAVGAYSTTDQQGPLSAPVSYSDSPHILSYPLIDYNNMTIDVTFNENNMQGADIKNNYDFSPTILFAQAGIVQMDRTYRLFMDYIPEHTIITMTLSNVTDNKGLALISASIVLNDNDNDNMADDWEVQNGLNPLLDDAGKDIDGDGIINLYEYNEGMGITNRIPERPVLVLPGNTAADIELAPQFETDSYVDYEKHAHFKTQWQISTEASFIISENIVFDLVTYDSLTCLTIPEFILDPGRTYYWRVRFFDILNGRSLWSAPNSFTTLTINPEDSDGDGVPDIQQVTDGTIDLDSDGYMDVSSAAYKMVINQNAITGSISFGLEASDNVVSVDCLKSINPDDISDKFGKPTDLYFGLIQFRLRVDNIGDAARVKIYFSKPVGKIWYKYDLINGWREYSKDYPDNVQFSSDGKSVLLRLVDGGPGDSDGVANGIIVDPSGPGGVAKISSGSTGGSASSASSSSGGGGGCFIATAAFGSYMEKHVQILKDFRDEYLLKSRLGTAFVRTYYRYSPSIADIIARHRTLRAVVRIGLMPLVGFGYLVIHISPFEQIILIILMMSMTAILYTKRHI